MEKLLYILAAFYFVGGIIILVVNLALIFGGN